MPAPLFVLALVLFATEAPALPPPAAAPAPVRAPFWQSRPTIEEMNAAWTGGSGRAALDCDVALDGRVSNCAVAGESPMDQGLGAAALTLASRMRMDPATRAAQRYSGGRVRIPFIWRSGTCPPLAAWSTGKAPPEGAYVNNLSNASPIITNPDWMRRPTLDDIARYYPDHALRNGIRGRVVISCTVTGQGLLTRCLIVSETPEGEDFGAASLRLAGKFMMRPMTNSCEPVEGATVRIPLNWTPPE